MTLKSDKNAQIIAPQFTEQDINNLMILLNVAVKSVGIDAVRSVTRIADVIQAAVDEARAEKLSNSQISLPLDGDTTAQTNGAGPGPLN